MSWLSKSLLLALLIAGSVHAAETRSSDSSRPRGVGPECKHPLGERIPTPMTIFEHLLFPFCTQVAKEIQLQSSTSPPKRILRAYQTLRIRYPSHRSTTTTATAPTGPTNQARPPALTSRRCPLTDLPLTHLSIPPSPYLGFIARIGATYLVTFLSSMSTMANVIILFAVTGVTSGPLFGGRCVRTNAKKLEKNGGVRTKLGGKPTVRR